MYMQNFLVRQSHLEAPARGPENREHHESHALCSPSCGVIQPMAANLPPHHLPHHVENTAEADQHDVYGQFGILEMTPVDGAKLTYLGRRCRGPD
jgi:hypothetical protein